MKKRAANLLAVAIGTLIALLAAEAGVRIFWAGAPATFGRAESLPLQQVRDPAIIYRLVPGSTGFYNGTEFSVNSLGLRDRDYAIPAPSGTHRILVLGDSLVFGIGLPPGQTLPAQLERRLDGVEVINAGVFGYNLQQEISLLSDVGLRYHPDVVVACFCHNDIENWGLGEGGAVPTIRSSRFDPPPPDAWSTRLAGMLLPGGFDADRLNLLPEAGTGLRHWLATHSRLYLFVYLRLRLHSWNMTTGERPDPLVRMPTCEAERAVWEPLRLEYRRLRSITTGSGATLAVVIHNALIWQGWPLQKLERILSQESIPFLDMTPVWQSPAHYASEYSLGWDPHPNARANEVAAQRVAAFLATQGMVPGGASPAAGPEADPPEGLASRQMQQVREDERRWAEMVAGLLPAVSLPGTGAARGQILYGFWDHEPGRPLPQPADGLGHPLSGAWMSGEGSVLLGRPPGASRLVVDLVAGSWRPGAGGEPPRSLHVTLSAPPDRCGIGEEDISLTEGTAAGKELRLVADLPEGLPDSRVLEVSLSVDRPLQATYLAPDGEGGAPSRDPRLVSFFVRRVALE